MCGNRVVNYTYSHNRIRKQQSCERWLSFLLWIPKVVRLPKAQELWKTFQGGIGYTGVLQNPLETLYIPT